MRQGNLLVNLVMVMLAAALCCYLGFYVWNSVSDPFSTTYAYAYQSYDSVAADGFLARAELVLPAQSGIVDVTRGEGEKVGAGQEVALVHRDSQAVAAQQQLASLEMELSILDDCLSGAADAGSSARLDQSILDAMVDLRACAAVGDYAHLETQIVTLKSQVLKRDYTYERGMDLSELGERRAELAGQYQQLSGQTAGVTHRITAPAAGIFSALVDGYESVLTPESVFTLTPGQLDKLSPEGPPGEDIPGKLITDYRWYFVCALPREDAQRCRAGDSVILRLSGDFSRDVTMTVEQVEAAEDGRCAVVLSSNRFLAQTALLRRQSAELVFSRRSGLRLPKLCVRMVTRTVTGEDGREQEINTLGVYAVVSGQAEFKPVEIISEGSDYYVVAPATQDSRALRAGDEVIVRATGLYDGKLLEY